jgi:hypothetical protein
MAGKAVEPIVRTRAPYTKNIKRSQKERQRVVCIETKPTILYKNSLRTAGVISLSLALDQALPGTGSLAECYEDDNLPFFIRSLNVLCPRNTECQEADIKYGSPSCVTILNLFVLRIFLKSCL